jgi:hypothetical protein
MTKKLFLLVVLSLASTVALAQDRERDHRSHIAMPEPTELVLLASSTFALAGMILRKYKA